MSGAGLALAVWIAAAAVVVVAGLAGLGWIAIWLADRLAGWLYRRRARGQRWGKR
jgi:hypothetical protein